MALRFRIDACRFLRIAARTPHFCRARPSHRWASPVCVGGQRGHEVLVAEFAWWKRGDRRSGIVGACPIAARGEPYGAGVPFHRRLPDRSTPPGTYPGVTYRT